MFPAAAEAALMEEAVVLRAYLSSVAGALTVVETFASLLLFHVDLKSNGFVRLRRICDPRAFARIPVRSNIDARGRMIAAGSAADIRVTGQKL